MAHVVIEESQLGELRWGVFIERPGEIISRTVWGRYAHQLEAQDAADVARCYLAQQQGRDSE